MYFSKKKFSTLSFAVVGSGPGGFYTSKHLLKKYPNAKIDFFERLPHPYGLVRTGVAPDHQSVKNVEKDFHQVIEDSRVRFLGNVEVGNKDKDVSFELLKQNYSSIILSYGAASENELGLKNEDAFGCFSARNFVNWYNGHVFYSKNSIFAGNDKTKRFEDANDVVIIGNGNVAVDVARILAKTVEALHPYDIPDSVLEVLSRSKVKNIHMIARRGVMQSAFTLKEIKELAKVEGVSVYIYKDELEKSLSESQMAELASLSFAEKKQYTKKADLMKTFHILEKNQPIPENNSRKNIILRYCLAPEQILTSDSKVSGMVFRRTNLVGKGTQNTEETETINSQVVFKSIGYKSVPVFDEIQFDKKQNIVGNEKGVVFDAAGKKCDNIFTVGWVKIGAKGIIDTTLRDSFETAESIVYAVNDGLVKEKEPDFDSIVKMVRNKGKVPVTYPDWKKIDTYEIEEGKKKGKIREKIVDLSKMLSLVQH